MMMLSYNDRPTLTGSKPCIVYIHIQPCIVTIMLLYNVIPLDNCNIFSYKIPHLHHLSRNRLEHFSYSIDYFDKMPFGFIRQAVSVRELV